MKIIFVIIVGLHALLHFLGTLKAFRPNLVPQIKGKISIFEGLIWLLVGLLLLSAELFYILNQDLWPILGVTGALLSQLLISLNWRDSKYGTIINLLIFAVSLSKVTW